MAEQSLTPGPGAEIISDVTSDEVQGLLERWIRGDREAAAEIYRRYYKKAWRFGLALTKREVEAEELAQEAIAAGLEVLRDGKRPDRFTGWLLGIVKHLAWRENGRAEPLPADAIVGDPDGPAPAGGLIQEEMNAVLQGALQDLPEEDRSLVLRRVLERTPREDLARELNCSSDTIDRRVNRCLALLRDRLSGHFTTLVVRFPAPSLAQVNGLRPAFRQAFVMRHLEDLPVEEIAARLAVPVGTVEERLAYAYQVLRCTAGTDFSSLKRPV